MDLEKGRARWIMVMLLLLICALGVCLFTFRRYERHEEADNRGGLEEDIQHVQEPAPKQEPRSEFLDIGIVVRIGTQQQEIRLYRDEEQLYIFVPGAADTASMWWNYDEELYEVEVMGDGRKAGDGDGLTICSGEDGEEKIRIKDIREESEEIYGLHLVQSASLPAVFISTQSGTMDWIHAEKGNRESGELLCVDGNGVPEYAGAMKKIAGRGNSSWAEDKRSYTITLAEEAGMAGMPPAAKWVLQANALDATRMRNKVTYDLARDLGLQYAIDSAYADLWLNGEYAGNYLVCEKIEAGEERVDISTGDFPQKDDGRYTRDNEGAWWEYEEDYERRNGYLLEFNDRIGDDEAGYFYSGEQQVEVKIPEGLTCEEYRYISEYAGDMAESLENAAQSDAYLEYIDLDSWSLLFLINELTNDTDANRYSVFYYKDKGTKMYAGPVWDYDIAWGNDFLGRDVRCSFSRNGWYGTLYDNETFYRSITEKYEECMRPVLENYLDEYIESVCGQIRLSVQMDDIRWAHSEGYTRRSPERDWQEAVACLKDYMRRRMEFFDDVWLSGEQYYRIFFRNGDTAVAVTYIREGDTIPDTLLGYVAGCLAQDSWRTAEGQTYDASQGVYSDLDLYAQKAPAQASDAQ